MSAGLGMALFDTGVGCCGVVWGENGIVSVALPANPRHGGGVAGNPAGAARARTRASLAAAYPDAAEGPVPAEARAAIDGMVALLAGAPVDLAEVRVDLAGVPEFHERVYEVARAIPPGQTLTYGEVAVRLGMPGAAQAVGQALGSNPIPIIIPCHRVVAAGGLGGFSAPGGSATKRRMLEIEGALAPPPPTLFDDLFADS
ncbi:MGMT family protein [Frankia sp. CNm7]|uniref:methylated-DNA--[protein]-cysteine S-methyltransferase n=1 Tax=Frankia nepalensis TaxID=1836974 RepID=A0A937UNC9_9ACTN|nr:MGMT family protein [Frankia nepalensis]MBL7498414.1 MGMT family protein [Frankia nepalensis]MBL7509972.1 MGMT family protein [Frankia nepalensis]MBL7520190.1 MGMT family protein [Frankia nepalensis]MBL7629744.1 MGMT family protein [Frankia nepalensis]